MSMIKKIIFFSALLITCYFLKPEPELAKVEISDDIKVKNLLQNKKLQLSFQNILVNKQEPTRTPSSYQLKDVETNVEISNNLEPSSVSSDAFAERFKNELNADEQREVLSKLQIEITEDRNSIQAMKENNSEDNIEEFEKFEERITQKENELAYLTSLQK